MLFIILLSSSFSLSFLKIEIRNILFEARYLISDILTLPSEQHACCSEGKVKISDIKYLASNKIFLISILRKDRENEDDNKIINSIIKFEFVQSTKSKNIDQNEPETELELLAIDLFKREHNFEITLLFSKNRFITLTSEIIEAVLEDQKIENDKSN